VQPKTHHPSDVDHWGGHPDRNYFIFVGLSVFFGFFGLDHFYLRSFSTGTQKFFINMLTLGFWYFWDVIQIANDGAKIRKDGLNSPLDWIRGIGRGTFRPIEKTGEPNIEAEKSYLLYAFLAIFFGWLGADKFYMGETWQGIAKLLSCFNIFLFLFGWLWVAWDGFHAFFLTESLIKDGISPPMPYSYFFNEPTPGYVFLPGGTPSRERNEGGIFGTLDWIARTFGFPAVPKGLPLGTMYKEVVAPLFTPPLVKALERVTDVSSSISHSTIPQMPQPQVPTMPQPQVPTMPQPQVPTMPQPQLPIRQAGGGFIEAQGPGPVIAGALTAVILAGGLKGFYDVISRQYE